MTRHNNEDFFCTISLVVHLDSTTLEDVQQMVTCSVMNCPEQLTVMVLKVKKQKKAWISLINEEFFIPPCPHITSCSEIF